MMRSREPVCVLSDGSRAGNNREIAGSNEATKTKRKRGGKPARDAERYESSVVAMRHLQTFRDKFAEQFSSMVTRRRFTVYGSPDAELKTMLDGFGATYLRPFGGLAYWP